MSYDDFLKTFIEENKDKVERNTFFSGYDKLVDKCCEFISNKMNSEFPRPDINSEEYHDYYKNMMVMKAFCDAFQRYNNYLIYETLPDGMYYEVTYNKVKDEFYLDAYKKFENRCIPNK